MLFLIGILLQLSASPSQGSSIIPPYHYNTAAWGDSLTVGNEDGSGVTYPIALTTITQRTGLIGENVFNGGVGGYTSAQIEAAAVAATAMYPYCQLTWSGRNDPRGTLADQNATLSNIAGTVAVAPAKCFLVLSILNGEYAFEQTGQNGLTYILNLNSAISSAYPTNYLDIRTALVNAANMANVLDVWDFMQDVPASSLRATGTGTSSAIADTSTCSFTYTLSTGDTAGGSGDVLLIGTEYIYIATVTGTQPGPFTVSACTRGYASSTAATHSNGASLVDTTPLHLSAAGYTFVAQQVATWLAANAGR